MSDYQAALTQAEADLAAHEARGEALRSAITSLKALVALTPSAQAPKPKRKRRVVRRKSAVKRKRRKSQGEGHPEVPSNRYAGMGPTQAYRAFITTYGADTYTVPQIRDALMQGGVRTTGRTALLTGIHGVRRRDRIKAEKQQAPTAPAGAATEGSSSS